MGIRASERSPAAPTEVATDVVIVVAASQQLFYSFPKWFKLSTILVAASPQARTTVALRLQLRAPARRGTLALRAIPLCT